MRCNDMFVKQGNGNCIQLWVFTMNGQVISFEKLMISQLLVELENPQILHCRVHGNYWGNRYFIVN